MEYVVFILLLAGGGFYLRYWYAKDQEQIAAEAKAESERLLLEAKERDRLAAEAARFRFDAIPFQVRAAHHWIVGGSGHGKTQTLQHLISLDLPKVLMGEMTVIVMDSQSQIIPLLASLDLWKNNPDKFRYIDPAYNPPALNLFNVNPESPAALNATLETYKFIINSIFETSAFTDKQAIIFDMLLPLMARIKGATIDTLFRLLSDDGINGYEDEVASLTGTAQRFLTTDYMKRGRGDQYAGTREEVARRLYSVLSDSTLDRMFSHRRMDVDFLGDMQAGKLILIDTNKGFFQRGKSSVIGAIFLGLLYQAIVSRGVNAKPCVIYIDECHEYFKHTGHVLRSLLEQARKFNVGVVMAHQDLDQLNEAQGLLGGLSANTAIKMAGGTSHHDAKTLAPMLRTTEAAIYDTTKGEFVTSVPSVWRQPQLFTAEFGRIERMPRASSTRPTPPTPEPELAFATDPPPERPKPGGRQTF